MITIEDKLKHPYKANLYFHMGHAEKLIGRTKRTLYKWIKQGKISPMQTLSGHWLFSLDMINDIRDKLFMPPITEEEAITFWENY